METDPKVIDHIDALFHPRSIAIIGAPRGMKPGAVFLTGLLDQGFPGPIYLVNPRATEINGLKTYAKIADIPGPVDLAIILVSSTQALKAVRECAARGVKGALLFTAGFKETGTEEGRALEEEMVRAARAGGMRLIGPNGMGLYCPKTGLSFFPGAPKESGPVGIISHSGSLASILVGIASGKGIRFSKVISSGNDCDLTAADFLSYLVRDSDTGLIGGYIEGIKDGPYFLRALKEASLQKPVILWKVGLTPEGARASASHTGALAGSRRIWGAVERQTGVVSVVGFEAWVDALMGFTLLPSAGGPKMAVISGPGGLAVSAAEACGNEGLRLASLSDQTRSRLAAFVPSAGTSLKNPVDVSLTAHMDLSIFRQSVEVVSADPEVDAVVIIGSGLDREQHQVYAQDIIALHQASPKPLIIVKIAGHETDQDQALCQAGIPCFDSPERAMHTYALVVRHQRWRQKQPELR
jgi:acyl-CoA synthetase (NDP forming)